MSLLQIAQLRLDGGTQPRAAIDRTVIDDYGREMRSGVSFPPVIVFYDGTDYWLADGFHRVGAAEWTGDKEIECDVRQGTREDAQWYSFGANQHHGLRRTNEDKQRAVKAALEHPKSQGLSDHTLARHVGVDVKTIGNWRGKLSMEVPQIADRTVTRSGKTYQQNTENIGKRREPKTPEVPTPISEPPASLPDRPPQIPVLTNKQVWAAQATKHFTKELLRLVKSYEKAHSPVEALVITRRNGVAIGVEVVSAREEACV